MNNNFFSVYDVMPPLNVLCEIVTSTGDVFEARFIFDVRTLSARWWRKCETDGVSIKAAMVKSWRIIETKEECVEWLNSLSNRG